MPIPVPSPALGGIPSPVRSPVPCGIPGPHASLSSSAVAGPVARAIASSASNTHLESFSRARSAPSSHTGRSLWGSSPAPWLPRSRGLWWEGTARTGPAIPRGGRATLRSGPATLRRLQGGPPLPERLLHPTLLEKRAGIRNAEARAPAQAAAQQPAQPPPLQRIVPRSRRILPHAYAIPSRPPLRSSNGSGGMRR